MNKVYDLKIWNEFEYCLDNAGEISFWIRDDDIKAQSHKFFNFDYFKYFFRLEKLLKIYNKFNIPTILAVIPFEFCEHGKDLEKLLKKYNIFVCLHGSMHINNSLSKIASEYPDGCDINNVLNKILDDKKMLEDKFGKLALPVFVPPYNYICPNLKMELLKHFNWVSTANLCVDKRCDFDVDIDFENWENFTQKSDEEILLEIINLINIGAKSIGFNAHHKYIKHNGFDFFEKFFDVVSKHKNIKWINPF